MFIRDADIQTNLTKEGGGRLRRARIVRWRAEEGKGGVLFVEVIVEVMTATTSKPWTLLYLHGTGQIWDRPVVMDERTSLYRLDFERHPSVADFDRFQKATLWGYTGPGARSGNCADDPAGPDPG